MTVSLKEALANVTSVDDLKILPLPVGVYNFKIIKAVDDATVQKDFDRGEDHFEEGFEYIEVTAKPIAPVSVDEEELEEVQDWTGKLVNMSFFTAEDMRNFVNVADNIHEFFKSFPAV